LQQIVLFLKLVRASPWAELEIGTGSGYPVAVLAQLVKQVYTIEIVPQLAQSARRTLTRLGYSNVAVREGDGDKGWPEQAPFDRIILTAPPEVPKTLVDELVRGGRIVAGEPGLGAANSCSR